MFSERLLTIHVCSFHVVLSELVCFIAHPFHILLHHLGVLIHPILLHGFHHLPIDAILLVFLSFKLLLAFECFGGLLPTDLGQACDHFFLFS